MSSPDYVGALKLLYDWQTLAAGVLALIAAVATIRATTKAADRAVAAAQQQVAVAQKQIAVAQEQIAVAVRTERRRITRESYAFLAMLKAAMRFVIEDIEAAQKIVAAYPPSLSQSTWAYAARQQIKKTGFADLRSACVRLGGQHTTPFLDLERAIDDLAEERIDVPSAGDDPVWISTSIGLAGELNALKIHANALRDEADTGLTRCNAILAETEEQRAPGAK